MKRCIAILLALALLAACGIGGQAAAPEKESGPSSVPGPTSPSSLQSETEGPLQPSGGEKDEEAPEFPPPETDEETDQRRANALFSDLSTLFSLSKDSYSYFTCYSGGGPVTLEIGVTDEAAVDAYLAAWTGTKWDELRKVPGRASQARQEEFAQAAEKLDLGPDVSFHVTARNGPSLTETGRIFVSVTVTDTEPLEDIPQQIKDLAEEMGIPEDMLFFLCNVTSGAVS